MNEDPVITLRTEDEIRHARKIGIYPTELCLKGGTVYPFDTQILSKTNVEMLELDQIKSDCLVLA